MQIWNTLSFGSPSDELRTILEGTQDHAHREDEAGKSNDQHIEALFEGTIENEEAPSAPKSGKSNFVDHWNSAADSDEGY